MVKINNTEKPIFYKTWIVKNIELTDETIAFLKGLNVTVNTDNKSSTVSHNGVQYQYTTAVRFIVETTCEKQESMLKLRYGSDLFLLMSEVVMPNSMQTTLPFYV